MYGSANGQAKVRFDAPLVFAGYGISAPDLGYDDYAGLDVRGRIVLVLAFLIGAPLAALGSLGLLAVIPPAVAIALPSETAARVAAGSASVFVASNDGASAV